MSDLALAHLQSQRKNWRKQHPHGFYAKPEMNEDGSEDWFKWTCGIPAKYGFDVYTLTMTFPDDYPSKPPKCQFVPRLVHPNVNPDGTVSLSILAEDWNASVTLKQILTGIHDLLTEPKIHNLASEINTHQPSGALRAIELEPLCTRDSTRLMHPPKEMEVEFKSPPTPAEPYNWTTRTESTLIIEPTLMNTTPSGMNESSLIQPESNKEPDPRAAYLSLQTCPYQILPIILRQYFHDYDISRAIGLPYLSIPIIDTISDYLCVSAPMVGSRDFRFEHYWARENRVRNLAPGSTKSDEDYFVAFFPFHLRNEPTKSNDERYHELTAIGKRDETDGVRGECIDLGDLYLQRRVWSIFAGKSRDEIRLEDYRTMSEAELDGSLGGSAVEVLDEWGRRRGLVDSHWSFMESVVGALSDADTQITFSNSLDLQSSNDPPSSQSPCMRDILYQPNLKPHLCISKPTTYTAISPDLYAYSFQLHVIETDVKRESARVCYFGFGSYSLFDSTGKVCIQADSSGSYKLPFEFELPVLEMKHDITNNIWTISTVPGMNALDEPIKIVSTVAADPSTIFTCQKEGTHIRWLVNGTLIYEHINRLYFPHPNIFLTSRLHLKLKHQPGPNPPITLDHLPTSFDEAAAASEAAAATASLKPLDGDGGPPLPFVPQPHPLRRGVPKLSFMSVSPSSSVVPTTNNSTSSSSTSTTSGNDVHQG